MREVSYTVAINNSWSKYRYHFSFDSFYFLIPIKYNKLYYVTSNFEVQKHTHFQLQIQKLKYSIHYPAVTSSNRP